MAASFMMPGENYQWKRGSESSGRTASCCWKKGADRNRSNNGKTWEFRKSHGYTGSKKDVICCVFGDLWRAG